MSISIKNSITNFQYLKGIVEYVKIENTATHISNNSNKNIDMDYDDIIINKKESNLYGQISLILLIKVHNDDASGISLNYKIKGLFVSEDAENEKEFEDMLKTNGLAVLYSMARAHISTFTSLSGLESVNIPMINVYSYILSKEGKNE